MAKGFPTWTLTLQAMHDHGADCKAICDGCGKGMTIDVAALLARVGPEYSLIDRRCMCRITPGCRGWNKFYYRQAVFVPLWTHERALYWALSR